MVKYFFIFDENISTVQHVFDKKGFGRSVKQKRVIELDLDMRTLATKLGLSAATISRVENAAFTPDVMTYHKLCTWMGVPLTTFIKKSK